MEVVGTGDAARVFIAGTFTSAANTISPTTTVNQPHLLAYNLQTGLIDTRFRPTFGGGGVTAVEATPDGTKLFVGRLVQHRQRGGPAEGRQPQPHHRRTDQHLRVHPQHQQPGARRWPPPTRRCTSGAGSAASTACSRPASPPSTPPRVRSTLSFDNQLVRRHRRQRPARRAPAQAHPRREQAARRAHRPADRRPGPLRHGHHRHRHQGAAALAQPAVGRQPGPRRRRHPHRRRRHRPRRLLLRGDQRIGWRRAADQRHGRRLPAQRRVAAPSPTSSRSGSRGTSTASTRWPSPRWRSTSVGTSVHRVAVVRRPLAGPRQRRLRHRPGPGRLRPRRPGRPPRPHRRDRPRRTARRWSGTPWADPTPSRATRPWRPLPAVCSSAATACSRAGCAPDGSAFFDFNTVPFPAPAARHHDHDPDRGPGRRQQRAVRRSRARRGSPPGPSAGCRSRSRDRDSGQYLQDNGTAFTTFGSTANTLERHARRQRNDPDLVRSRPPSRPTATCWSTAQAFTAATGGTGDSTRATKKFESFSTDDQTPTTTITGPSGIQTSTTLHDDRHRERRQGRQLAELLVPRRAEPLPAGRRHGGRHLQHLPRARRTSSGPPSPPGPTR